MSATIDQKVVEMRFDNKDFEKNTHQTMSTLEKLKQSLKLNGATNGLEEVQKSANRLSFANIENMLTSLERRFSTMGIVGMTVTQNLTSSLMGYVARLFNFITGGVARLSNFVTGGIIQGGFNRARNLEKARFQLKGLLKDASAVEAVMKDVNYGVEDTAYTLDAAANVAAQLAASGMRAGDGMRTALRGISGVAAMTNSTYEDIGGIYTQVAGQGRLMGDQLLQLSGRGINAAAILAKYLNKTEAEVRDMTSKGKIDFATFAAAMDDAFGEHAKEANKTLQGVTANIRAAFAKVGAEFINPIIANEGPLVGFLNGVREKINEMKLILIPLAQVLSTKVSGVLLKLGDAVKKIDLTGVKSFVDKLIEFFKETKTNKKTMQNLKDTLKGFVSILSIVYNLIKNIVSGVGVLLKNLTPLGQGILFITGALGRFLSKVNESIKKSNIFTKVIEKVTKALQTAINKIKQLFTSSGISSFIDVLKKLWEFISFIGGKVVNMAAIIVNGIIKAFSSGSGTLNSLVSGTLLGTILLKIKQFVDNFHSTSKQIVSIVNSFKQLISGVTGVLKGMQEDLEAKKMLKIAIAIGILAVSLKLLSTIPMEDLIKGLGGIGILFGELIGALKILSNYMGDIKKVGRTSALMIAMSISILILAGALKKVASIETEKLLPAMIALGFIMGIMLAVAKGLGTGGKQLEKGAGQLILMAVAVRILANAIKAMGKLEPEQLIRGLAGFGAIMFILVGLSSYMSRQEADMIKGSAGIIAMAIGIRIIASAIKAMGSMENDQFLQGLAGFGAIMLILVGLSSYLSRHGSTFTKGGASMLILSVSLLIMAKVAKQLGQMEWESLGKAGAAIGGILIFAAGLALIGKMGPSLLLGASGLLVAGIALAIFVPVIKKLGEIDFKTIGIAMLYLAGVLTVLGVAAYALVATGALAAMAALAGVLLLFGAGIALVGVGLMMIGAGITALAASLTVSAAAIVAQLTIILTGIIMLIPNTVKALAEGLVLFIQTIANSFGQIADAFVTIIIALCDILIQCVPKIVETLLVIFTALLESLAEHLPDIIDAGMRIVIAFIEGIALKLPDLIQAGFDLIISFINGLADAIRDNAQAIKDAMVNLGTAMIDGLCTFLGINSPSTKFMEIGKYIIEGLIEGIESLVSNPVNLVKDLATKAANAIVDKVGKFKDAGKKIITKLKDGMLAIKDDIASKAKSIATGAIDAIKEKVEKFKDAGKQIITGLKDGIESAKDKVFKKIKSIADGAMDSIKKTLGIHSPSTVFRKIGIYTIQGMVNGITAMGKMVGRVTENVGNLAINGMNKSIDKVADLLSTDVDAEPTITPVLDLSEIQNGVGKMNSMFNNQSVGINANLNAISNMSRNRMNSNNEMLSAIKDLGKSLNNAGTTNNYNVNGIKYSGDGDIQSAIETLVRAANVERRA